MNNFYASIRGGDIYACVCNGNFIGDSYRLHPPARTFHTAIDPEWHFWTPAEFEAWCRRLAEDYIGLTDADYFPDLVCADCFEFTSEFKPERWEELQLTREKTRLETMSDSDVFECEKLKRDEKYARCRAKFSPTRPAGWNDAKFCEWRHRLVRYYFLIAGTRSYKAVNAYDRLICPQCFSAEYSS